MKDSKIIIILLGVMILFFITGTALELPEVRQERLLIQAWDNYGPNGPVIDRHAYDMREHGPKSFMMKIACGDDTIVFSRSCLNMWGWTPYGYENWRTSGKPDAVQAVLNKLEQAQGPKPLKADIIEAFQRAFDNKHTGQVAKPS